MKKKYLVFSMQYLVWLRSNAIFYILYTMFFCSPLFTLAQKTYSEDLSKLRPKIEMPADIKPADSIALTRKPKPDIAATHTVNTKVDAVLDSIDRINVTRRFLDGFTIQIYSGQKKDDANYIIKKLQDELPMFNPRLRYEQPKFRVTIGGYYTKLDAQSDLLLLKRKFSTASLVPEKILLK